MASHTSESSSNDGSTDGFPNIELAECVQMDNRPSNVDSTVTSISVGTVISQVQSHDRYDENDDDVEYDTTIAKEKYNDSSAGLLPSSAEKNARIFEAFNMSKFQVMKNLCILCTSFFLLFTSFLSMSNLQSSINKEEGVGTVSLIIVYVAMMFSSMFLSSISIYRFGLKLSMCLSMIMYVLYMAANLYPVWGIIVPTAVLCGLAAGPLWASQSSYLSHLSKCYAQTNNMETKDSLSYLFGIFYMCANAGKISGNLLASLVLKQDNRGNRSMTLKEIEDCMANNQEAVENATTLERPDDTTIYSICGVWIGVSVIGILTLAFLNPVTVDVDTFKNGERKQIFNKFLSTAKHLWRSRAQKLMVPITLYYGTVSGFLTVDFTKSIVGCTFGIQTVGDVMLCHGICNTVSSALIGRLVKHLGHLSLFTFMFLCYGGVQVFLIVWKPGPEYGYLFYIFAGMWGVSDAIIKTQVLAIYGHLFVDNTEAAYGNYFVFEATGYIISFSYSLFLSTDVKLYILLGLLVCSAVLYYTVEYIDRKKSESQDKDTERKSDC